MEFAAWTECHGRSLVYLMSPTRQRVWNSQEPVAKQIPPHFEFAIILQAAIKSLQTPRANVAEESASKTSESPPEAE